MTCKLKVTLVPTGPSGTAVDPRGRLQPEPGNAQATGSGDAVGAEKSLRGTYLARSLATPARKQAEPVSPSPCLRTGCEALQKIACPPTTPALQQISYLHHGLLGQCPAFRRNAKELNRQIFRGTSW